MGKFSKKNTARVGFDGDAVGEIVRVRRLARRAQQPIGIQRSAVQNSGHELASRAGDEGSSLVATLQARS